MNAKEQQAKQISRVDRAATILDRALELNSTERNAYIEGACGDDVELRKEVEAMLQAHEEAGDFLAAPTANEDAATIPSFPTEKPGTIIDRYKILQLIGEGGFGAVYMAEQQKPVKRRVALKIIKLGMDTKQVIARFEAERQALAMMDHPNIARVFDAGATETGRPYFVMELVKGVPITEYCDTESLSTKDRLDLFINVCHAVQHAHQKGIIHRDIKPSNVMVTLHDGKPVPKVIDFGIAKATNRELTDKTLFTEYRQLIGTPQYMSPEQAEMSGLDIDTRSDIYSLGVLLYELLTGTTPFDPKRLRSAALGEIQRIIREEEPDKPSTRLSSLLISERAAATANASRRVPAAGSPEYDPDHSRESTPPPDGQARDEVVAARSSIHYIAKHRKTEPAQLSRQLRGDLDWIIMKSLEKERARRYETANGLAADIQRHLSDEPVMAGAPSAAYRFRKFARRNRAALSTIAAVAVVLVIATIVSVIFGVQANAAKTKALAAEAFASQDRDRALKAESLATQRLSEAAMAIPSNYAKGNYIYLLNAEPGRYVAVACMRVQRRMAAPAAPASGLSVSFNPASKSTYTSYFAEDLIEMTQVTVTPGSVNFIGEYTVDDAKLKDADNAQLHYYRLIEPGAEKNRGLLALFSAELAISYRGSLHEVKRDDESEAKFLAAAKKHLAETGWSSLIARNEGELSPPSGTDP